MNKKRVLVLFVILQVVVSIMLPAPAHAATYAPEVVPFWGVTNLRVVQGVSNRFDAALGLIGEWGKKIQISNANYVALSNEGSGGAFYTLSQTFENADPNPIFSPEGVTGNPIAKVAWTGQIAYVWANYGSPAEWLWYCNVDDELIDAARTDFLKVLSGESLGGGGSGGGIAGLQFAFTANTGYFSASEYQLLYASDTDIYTNYSSANPNYYKQASSPLTLAIDGSYFSDFNYDLSDYDAYIVVYNSNAVSRKVGVSCILVSSDVSSNITANVLASGSVSSLVSSVATPYNKVFVSNTINGVPYTFDGALLSLSSNGLSFGFSSRAYDAGYTIQTNMSGNSFNRMCFSRGSSGGGGGDNHWPEPTTPDPDPQPTNPDPDPDPPDPPTFDPPGFDPDIPVPDVPVTIVPPDNTTAADYTPWLRAILTALNTIIDDLGEHCDHIRVAMRDYLSGLYEAISDDLESYYSDLTDYLSDLAKWIVSHLNFDIKQPDVNVNVPGYDDSSVIGWLRRIYYKLRGTGTPRPDPIEDTDGAFDWWSKFLEWITNALGGLLTDFVGDLGGFLQELIDTFPFSIPWDIVAMLTLLDAQRATPDFTVTIPAQDGWWDDITVRIELSAYNDAMATVRGMVMIWWMYILVMKTDWMMLLFDGANDAIADFVSRLTGKG